MDEVLQIHVTELCDQIDERVPLIQTLQPTVDHIEGGGYLQTHLD